MTGRLLCAWRNEPGFGPCSPRKGWFKNFGGRMYCKRHYEALVKLKERTDTEGGGA